MATGKPGSKSRDLMMYESFGREGGGKGAGNNGTEAAECRHYNHWLANVRCKTVTINDWRQKAETKANMN